MYGDPHAIRALARRMGDQAEATRSEADTLARTARLVYGRGLAVTMLCGAALERAAQLRATARSLDRAHDALLAHARLLEDLLALIAEIERRARHAVAAATGRVEQFLDRLLDSLDPRDEELARCVLPAPGSAAWLSVRLPGVALPPVPAR